MSSKDKKLSQLIVYADIDMGIRDEVMKYSVEGVGVISSSRQLKDKGEKYFGWEQ